MKLKYLNVTMAINLFMAKVKEVFMPEKKNRVERAIENLKEIREEIQEFDVTMIQRIENIEDILMGESH